MVSYDHFLVPKRCFQKVGFFDNFRILAEKAPLKLLWRGLKNYLIGLETPNLVKTCILMLLTKSLSVRVSKITKKI